MPQFQVYQIRVDRDSKESIDAFRDATMGWSFLEEHFTFERARPFYSHVADVTARDEEHVFELMNLWHDESAVRRLLRLHSLSVGDILIDEDGNRLFCDGVGFKNLGRSPDYGQHGPTNSYWI